MEQLISPFIDGELTQYEAEAVRVHLSACAACGREYESMVQLSAACKYMGEVRIPAPAGFHNTLMLRISNEEKIVTDIKSGKWFNRNWKQATAGIAAGVLLIIGTLSMNTGPVMQIAQNPPSVTQPGTTSPVVNDPGNTSPINSDPSGAQPSVTGQNTVGDPVVIPPAITNTNNYSPRILLNNDRFITTTLLQVKVTDSNAALQQVMSMADRANAQTQNLGQQVNDNGSYLLVKIIVPKSAASNLVSELSSLGTVTGKDVSNNDISNRYSDKLTQYQTLVTQRATLQDATQEAELDQRIKTIENELQDWEQKANEQTIVLWLQK